MRAAVGILALGVAMCLQALPALGEEVFFRYENGDGVTVIDDQVPPQLAHKGYQVLNQAGRVIEVVPRALTDAERRQPNNRVIQAQLRKEEEARQARYDDMLLARYSTVEDIDASRKRRLNEIRVRINLLKGTVANLKQRLETEQAQAAELERSGMPVPGELPGTVESLRSQIGVAEKQIEHFKNELKTTDMRFTMDVERFRILRPTLPSP